MPERVRSIKWTMVEFSLFIINCVFYRLYGYSKSKMGDSVRCTLCKGEFSIFLIKKKDGKSVMEPVRPATGIEKYLKEKYQFFQMICARTAHNIRHQHARKKQLNTEIPISGPAILIDPKTNCNLL